MAKRPTQIDRAINDLQQEIDVLEIAISKLKAHQSSQRKPAKPRVVAKEDKAS